MAMAMWIYKVNLFWDNAADFEAAMSEIDFLDFTPIITAQTFSVSFSCLYCVGYEGGTKQEEDFISDKLPAAHLFFKKNKSFLQKTTDRQLELMSLTHVRRYINGSATYRSESSLLRKYKLRFVISAHRFTSWEKMKDFALKYKI